MNEGANRAFVATLQVIESSKRVTPGITCTLSRTVMKAPGPLGLSIERFLMQEAVDLEDAVVTMSSMWFVQCLSDMLERLAFGTKPDLLKWRGRGHGLHQSHRWCGDGRLPGIFVRRSQLCS